jgi:hypothetical protein
MCSKLECQYYTIMSVVGKYSCFQQKKLAPQTYQGVDHANCRVVLGATMAMFSKPIGPLSCKAICYVSLMKSE